MDLIRYHLKRLFSVLRNEVLVLPSRVVVVVFFLGLLLLPLFTRDPYLLRILILTSIFAILAASWDLLSGFTGQMNFGHALFFGVGRLCSGAAQPSCSLCPPGAASPWAPWRPSWPDSSSGFPACGCGAPTWP